MSDTPQRHVEYTAGLGVDKMTECPYCHLLFDTEVDAYTRSTAHGTAAYPHCPLKRIYGYYKDGEWVEIP